MSATGYYPFGMPMPERTYDRSVSEYGPADTCITEAETHTLLNNFTGTLEDNDELTQYFNDELNMYNSTSGMISRLKADNYIADTLDFNGAGHVEYGDQPQYRFDTNSFSVEAWIYYPSGLSASSYTFISNMKYESSYFKSGFAAWINTNNSRLVFALANGTGTWGAGLGKIYCNIPSADDWHHVVLIANSLDATKWKIYVDGMEQSVTVGANNLGTTGISNGTLTGLKIGSRVDGHNTNDQYFRGSIKEVKVYQRIMGASEISSNASDMCIKMPGNSSNLVLWAPLDEGSGTNAVDLSSYSETGSFTGTNLNWGRAIGDTACTGGSMCFTRSLDRYYVASYRFGFNSQERDNEIAGVGNSYTAEFWQYDSRLGRRWNRDPVVKYHESPYATFANNPVWFVDPFGADTLDINKNDDGEWTISNTQIAKGDDVFRVHNGDETNTYTFSEGEYGERINVLNLENNDDYTLGVYHISGQDGEGATGFAVTPGGDPSTIKDSEKRLPDDVYELRPPSSHNLLWLQPGIHSGEQSGYVGYRGVRIHPTPSPLIETSVRQWTDGCYAVCTDYSLRDGTIYFNTKLSLQTSRQINLMLGATRNYDAIGIKKRPGSDFDNGFNFKLIQKSGF